jgi:BirA family biotin operon repressor/biotin-[acetyl-CoA-carboxylase] ligase
VRVLQAQEATSRDCQYTPVFHKRRRLESAGAFAAEVNPVSETFDALGRDTFVRRCARLVEVDSTNRYAAQWSRSLTDGDLPALVVADRQTAGRGRGGNRWWSSEGALTCSLLLAPQSHGLPTSRWPALSLAVGGAVAAALQPFAPGCDVRLKWPNDVYLGGRKVAGILVEPTETQSRLVVGVGVNVANSLREAPAEIGSRGTSLLDETGVRHSPLSVLTAWLRQLELDLAALTRQPDVLAARWRALCLLSGTHVVVNDISGSTAGTCLGIDDDGALRVQTAEGSRRLFSGTIAEQGRDAAE